MGILSAIVWTPLIGLVVILLLPKDRPALVRAVALATAGITLLWSWALLAGFDQAAANPQFAESRPWIPELGMTYTLAVDGLSLPLILLTTLLVFVALLASQHITRSPKAFYAWILLLETSCLGVFAARDWFLLYVFWEIALVPMFFLIGLWGGAQKERATMTYFLYTLGGSIVMLIGILAVYLAADPHTFDMDALQATSTGWTTSFQVGAVLALLAGFAVKIPIFPLHGWLPLAHVQAPAPVSIILSGVMLKLGAYGLLRSAEILPAGIGALAPLLFALGLVNIIYGALLAFRQRDLKAIVAFSSISHMGFVVLGIAALNYTGFSGAVFMMVAHGITTGGLFLLSGLLYERTKTLALEDIVGAASRMPGFKAVFTLILLASMGLPGLVQFPGEVQVLIGAFAGFGLPVLIAALGILIVATFTLRIIGGVLSEDTRSRWSDLSDLRGAEVVAVAPLVALTVILGVAPGIALRVSHSTIEMLIAWIG
ncbi:MAG: NADH-quinone oxidoreductase subunit M [Deinococcota bacterium]|jgi:NADH-quinone oxidoreductase subunit M|nr:NADH-quinone oxidoreductase subunit M [Deinococcota bacterium]